MGCPTEVLKLVERFARESVSYRSGSYNETQARREFIDPLFKALGWDIDNEAGNAEAYKDVVHEDAIKVGGLTKAPDYCFRIGGTRKFFVEAKKPSVNIKEDVGPAFQLRRYAWSAKLPLSILTDFQEFAVYDSRTRPDKTDGAAVARTMYLPYTKYEEQWDEIAGIFSKPAVLQGSFDRYADTTKGKKGTAEVDSAFLKDIEEWRDVLARTIALRNPDLTQRELNYAVQTTIDRIIFLRICEDRGIESYGDLQGLCNGANTYTRMLELFRRADQRYNSGLFHFETEKGRNEGPDTLTPHLAIDDKPLKDILKRLYYPDSPYEFSVLPADILGQVYEQFLGKVIRLTAGHRAVVEDKPEVKKAGGVYYTPTYIVDYIVKNTVGKLLEGSTPKKAAELRILDPACGSGSFLIGAFQHLVDWHRDWYVENDPAKHTKEVFLGPGGEWRLTTAEKKRILLNNIYGVDIDSQAVETTKLSLLLKVLEGETQESINAQLSFLRERALPDLSNNIKCGNSLIGPDFYEGQQLGLLDDDERMRINVFDWEAEFPQILGKAVPEDRRGFDAVIGNPPYVNAWGMFDSSPAAREYLTKSVSFQTAERHWDLYVLFLERGLALVRIGGRLSYIIPFAYCIQKYAEASRRLLLSTFTLESVADLRTIRVFGDVPVITIVPVVAKVPPDTGTEIQVRRPAADHRFDGGVDIEHSHTLGQIAQSLQRESMLRLDMSDLALRLCEKVSRKSSKLGDIAFVNYGAQMSSKERGRFGKDYVLRPERSSDSCRATVSGKELYRYRLAWSGRYVEYSLAAEMYGPRWPEFFELPKLMVRDITGTHRLELTADHTGMYCDHTILCCLRAIDIRPWRDLGVEAVSRSEQYELEILLGLLASRLVSAFYYLTLTGEGVRIGGGFHTYPTTVRELPVFDVAAASKRDLRIVREVGELACHMIALNAELLTCRERQAREVIERQILAEDARIDRLVYDLYELTPEEVAFVEETV